MLTIGWFVLNLGYGFDGSFRKLGDYSFVSRSLTGATGVSQETTVIGNRFRMAALGQVPVPLPQWFVMGVDLQKWDFERGLWSFLKGEWSQSGWWYYYFCYLVWKVPLGTLGLGLFALGVVPWLSKGCSPLKQEVLVALPGLAVLLLISSQTGMCNQGRYAIPLLPYWFILCGRAALVIGRTHWALSACPVLLLAWTAFSSLSVYPHSLSYFNELAGGPENGHNLLDNSNVDWQQDGYELRRWYDDHPQARPLHIAFFGLVDPKHYDIDYRSPEGQSGSRLVRAQRSLPAWP